MGRPAREPKTDPKKLGRPSGFTAPVMRKIVQALNVGSTDREAAEFAEVTFSAYCRKKETDDAFLATITKAKADARLRAVGTIARAVTGGDWKAAIIWLERRYPEEWGRRNRIDIVIKREAEQIAEQAGVDPEWLLRRADEIAAKMFESSDAVRE